MSSATFVRRHPVPIAIGSVVVAAGLVVGGLLVFSGSGSTSKTADRPASRATPTTATPATTVAPTIPTTSTPTTAEPTTAEPTTSLPSSSVPATPTAGSSSHVIFDYTTAGDPVATVAKLPSYIRGVSWLFPWKEIEPNAPVNGVATYDWAPVERAVAAASASGRISMLRIFAGRYSPSWVQPQVSFASKVPGGGSNVAAVGNVERTTMPIPWSPPFVTDWLAFIKAYGAEFDGNPGIYAIQMPGAGVDGEMSFPFNTQPANLWTSPAQPPNGVGSYPYSDAALTSAWDQIIDGYVQAFPSTPKAIDIDNLSQGKGAKLVSPSVLTDIVAHAESYGSKVMIQQNGLHAGAANTPDGKLYDGILTAASTMTHVGWQAVQGGNSEGALMKMMNVALATHATYLEIYPADCRNPEVASALEHFISSPT